MSFSTMIGMRMRLMAAVRLAFAAVGVYCCWWNTLPMAQAGQHQAKEMPIPQGMAPAAPPERFAPETLFEIINGDADLYLKAGFVALDYHRFNLKETPAQVIEVFAYEMESHHSAFAVFSVRRDPEAKPDPLARFAYRYRNSFFLVHGPFYVEVLARGTGPDLMKATQELAAAFVEAHPVPAASIPELDFFPPEGLIPASEALHPSGAFGFESFDKLFTARYRIDGSDVTAFFRRCRSPSIAAQLAADYQAFLLTYDGVDVKEEAPQPGHRLIRMSDRYTLVFSSGRFVLGVQDAASPVQARQLARNLDKKLPLDLK